MQKVAVMGGSERHILTLLPELQSLGHDVRFLGLVESDATEFLDAARRANVKVDLVKIPRDISPSALLRVFLNVRRYCPDIIHTHLIHAHVYGQLVARLLRVPSIATAHNLMPLPHKWYKRAPVWVAMRAAHGKADVTVAVSQSAADHLRSLGVAEPHRIEVVPHGADKRLVDQEAHDAGGHDALRAELGVDGSALLVGMAGRLISGKGHSFAIDAIAGLRREHMIDAHLVIAGSGPLRAHLEVYANEIHMGKYVHLVGYQDNVWQFLKSVGIVVIPTEASLGEGFGLVALEAMVCGIPVVATRVGSLPEIVIDGQTGLLVEPSDPVQLSVAIARLFHDSRLGAQCAANARSLIESDFRLDAAVQRIADLYELVTKGTAAYSPKKRSDGGSL
jgi:glycosyltransferase involved in cell wall biosynthesis